MLASLAKFAPAVLGKVAEFLIPGAGSVVKQIHEWYGNARSNAEKAEILKALQITEEKLNTFDSMFILLGRECGDLLDRVAELEKQGLDATDEIARAVLNRPELQSQFDIIASELAKLDGRVSVLEADVQRLDERYASVGAFAVELKAKQLTDTEVADFREFRKAKQFLATGRFAESEPILLRLANTQPKSAAVAVAQAVAKHAHPSAFDDSLRRAVKLRPADDELKRLAGAATVAVTRAHTPVVPHPTPARAPQPGDTLDGWLLETRLGGGGWGIVFQATKKGRTAAIKILRPELTQNETFVEAFRDEVSNLKKLRHANCVSVEENWYCKAFDCHYFTMPLLDGLNLEQHILRHGVPSTTVVMGWLAGLLDGLDHAHGHGLIHRDIKPQNVMILSDDRAMLIDFGIAGLDGDSALGISRFFAPPELHSLGEADARADLFMLAATLFYALRSDQPLRDRAWNKFKCELVPMLCRHAFTSALKADPKQRPASVLEMRALLQADGDALGRQQQEQRAIEKKERKLLARAREVAEQERKKLEEVEAARTLQEAERKQQEDAARQREAHELRCKQNLAKWQASGKPEAWVLERLSGWKNAAFQKLLSSLRQSAKYWPMAEADSKAHLGAIRARLVAEQRAGDQKAETERIAVEMRKVTHRKAGERKQILLPGGVTMSFAWCPPGSFQMGSREGSEDEKPVHQEVLKMGFWMGIHPVTQGQWKAVMGNNPSHFTGSFKSWWLGRRYSGDRRPVEQVSWDDTAKFRAVVKQKSGFDLRLPTEVEWEYACRGGTTTAFYWSSELNGRQANCNGNTPLGTDVTGPYSQQTTPVGYFAREYPHPWGLTDVHGNVYEWCADKYGSYSAGATDNPFWPAFGGDGVIRGGAWDSSAKHCRAAFRCRNGPDYQSSRVGFRLVAVPSGE